MCAAMYKKEYTHSSIDFVEYSLSRRDNILVEGIIREVSCVPSGTLCSSRVFL